MRKILQRLLQGSKTMRSMGTQDNMMPSVPKT